MAALLSMKKAKNKGNQTRQGQKVNVKNTPNVPRVENL